MNPPKSNPFNHNRRCNPNVNSPQNTKPLNRPNNTNKTLRSADKMIKNQQGLYHHRLETILLGLVVWPCYWLMHLWKCSLWGLVIRRKRLRKALKRLLLRARRILEAIGSSKAPTAKLLPIRISKDRIILFILDSVIVPIFVPIHLWNYLKQLKKLRKLHRPDFLILKQYLSLLIQIEIQVKK